MILSSIWLLGKPLSDASVTFVPPYSGSPEKATMAFHGLFCSRDSRGWRESTGCPVDTARHHHCAGFAANLPLTDNLARRSGPP